jgi:sugar phosphate isomerase/epimerase
LGVRNVELARVAFDDVTADLVLDSKLHVVSIQAKFAELYEDFERMTTFLRRVGCDIAVVSVLNLPSILCGKQSVVKFAKALDRLALRYRAEGITLAFHHHDFELKRVRGTIKLDWLLEASKEIAFVSDTYWCKKQGFEPRDVAKRIGDRLIGWHLRDYDEMKPKHPDCACGHGAIDFADLLKNAPKTVRYGAIEQNCAQPLVDVKDSLRHLQSIQAKEAL